MFFLVFVLFGFAELKVLNCFTKRHIVQKHYAYKSIFISLNPTIFLVEQSLFCFFPQQRYEFITYLPNLAQQIYANLKYNFRFA